MGTKTDATDRAFDGGATDDDTARYADVRRVLFVSPRGVARARIAAAYLDTVVGDRSPLAPAGYVIAAAGSEAVRELTVDERHSILFALLGEQIWVDQQTPPRAVTDELVEAFDLVVRVGGPAHVNVPDGTPVEEWDVPEVLGAAIGAGWAVRDGIRRRVEDLVADLGLGRRSLHVRDRPIPGFRQSHAAGHAAVPYPADRDDDPDGLFDKAEARLLVRVATAADTAAEVNGRGPHAPPMPVPWLVSAGSAASAVARELSWRSIGSAPHLPRATGAVAQVVDWLVSEGALRAFPEEVRDALRTSGQAQRRHDHPPERWPTGRAGVEPALAEYRHAEEDHESWEVVPAEMLRVYPDLRRDAPAWATIAG